MRSVSVLAQALLLAGVGPDGRPGVRVLVDQILHTFPAAEAEERAANVNLLYLPTHLCTGAVHVLCVCVCV